MKDISIYNKYLAFNDDALMIEHLYLKSLVKKYKTPFFCYSANQIKDNYKNLKKSFKKIKPVICYAVKANFNKKILNLVAQLGLGADVVSKGELELSINCNINKKKIVFSGVGKTEDEIIYALKKDIKQINVESEEELQDIIRLANNIGKKVDVSLRLNPDIDPETHSKISTGRLEDKFGITEDGINNIFRKYSNDSNLNINGISIHIGSQIKKISPFEKAFKKVRNLVVKLRTMGFKINTIDIGGGIGIIYDKKKDKIFKVSDYANIVEKYFYDLGVEIILEPGRYLVGSSGILISKVVRIKKGQKKDFLIIDAGMNNLIRPSLYNAVHQIFPIKKSDTKKKYEVVGPICESSDIFQKDFELSKLNKDDFLIICSVGAYGSSMASNYNLRDIADEFIIDGKKIY